MGKREQRRGDQGKDEEDRHSEEPRAHQQQHEATAAPGRLAARPQASRAGDRARPGAAGGDRCAHPRRLPITAPRPRRRPRRSPPGRRSARRRPASPACRSSTSPASYLETNDWNSSWLALPEAVIGVVCVSRALEDLDERVELRPEVQLRRLRRRGRRRHVGELVGEGHQRVGVGGQVLDQLPCCRLILAVARNADDASGDVAGAVAVLLSVGDRERGRAVVELRVLVGDERRPVLAVEHHRHLAGLERVRRRELGPGAGQEPGQLVVAVPVDQVLVPLEIVGPLRVARQARLAVGVLPLRVPLRRVVRGDALVEP